VGPAKQSEMAAGCKGRARRLGSVALAKLVVGCRDRARRLGSVAAAVAKAPVGAKMAVGAAGAAVVAAGASVEAVSLLWAQ